MVELLLVCPQEQVEPVCDLLEAEQALSVSVEDFDAHSDAQSALFGEPGLPAPAQGWPRSRVAALFGARSQAQAAADALTRALRPGHWGEHCGLEGLRDVPDQDWVRLTQAQFAPVPVTPDFWIVPSWHEAPAQARKSIRLDPGLAFGTGTHPTTRLCLRWIANSHPFVFRRALDYGCGSGILAIACALHGASAVDALDIDPSAVEQARLNALANGVHLACGLPEMARGVYDLVLANILATPLCLLAPVLCAHLAPGGSLLLSGILERQSEQLKAAYRPYIDLKVSAAEEGWVLMSGGS
jgi:ribosomal protein L11 methyltransferase